MKIRLVDHNHTRMFSVLFTMGALSGNIILQWLFLSPEVFDQVVFSGAITAIILAGPLSYFIGVKMRDVQQLTDQLEFAVNHDHLTGTCTRKSFYQQVAKLPDAPLIVIVTDIDHFKRINDEYSHQAGDSALKQFAAVLRGSCRNEDLVARFGGEEFVILMRNLQLDEAIETAQRLCNCVRDRTFMAEGHRLRITASFGVAESAGPGDIDTALHRADLASYRAKRDGRDRVYCFDPALDTGAVEKQRTRTEGAGSRKKAS